MTELLDRADYELADARSPAMRHAVALLAAVGQPAGERAISGIPADGIVATTVKAR